MIISPNKTWFLVLHDKDIQGFFIKATTLVQGKVQYQLNQ